MRNYIAVVFENEATAYRGLHALWQLDSAEEITVHGTAVVHRDDVGLVQVDTKETHPALATAVGVGIGALIGALLGPAGAAAGAAAGSAAATGAAVGAATGATIGVISDLNRSDTRDEAFRETRSVLGLGQSAVIADVTEDWPSTIDDRMRDLGGTVYRRPKSDVSNDKWWDDYPYLYPYEYVPDRYVP